MYCRRMMLDKCRCLSPGRIFCDSRPFPQLSTVTLARVCPGPGTGLCASLAHSTVHRVSNCAVSLSRGLKQCQALSSGFNHLRSPMCSGKSSASSGFVLKTDLEGTNCRG